MIIAVTANRIRPKNVPPNARPCIAFLVHYLTLYENFNCSSNANARQIEAVEIALKLIASKKLRIGIYMIFLTNA